MVLKGVRIDDNKNVYIGLTYIYGIGKKLSEKICKKYSIDMYKKIGLLNNEEIKNINQELDTMVLTGDLSNQRKNYILDLISIKCNRGIRHVKKLPVRGQNTKNNAITCTRAKKW